MNQDGMMDPAKFAAAVERWKKEKKPPIGTTSWFELSFEERAALPPEEATRFVEFLKQATGVVPTTTVVLPLAPHCPTCVCGKRAVVQQSSTARGEAHDKGPGTISWEEHEEAWAEYARQYGTQQSAERMAERGGFSYSELAVHYLKREPKTWRPAGRGDLGNKPT